MKTFVQTIVGVVALISGISLFYFFMAGLSTGFNFIFLILSLLFIGAGGFLFYRVSKMVNANPEMSPALEPAPTETGTKLLEKNNQLVKDYSQTNYKKDNLKAVQMAVSAEATVVAEEGK